MRDSYAKRAALLQSAYLKLGRSLKEGGARIGRERKYLPEPILEGHYALDTSVLLEMLLGTADGTAIVESLSSGSLIAYTSEVNLAEAGYILCRKLGSEGALSKIQALSDSNYLQFIDEDKLRPEVIRTKCSRAIALGDCYCLATAKASQSRALFAFKETELLREHKKKPFDVEIVFLS